MTDRQSMSAGLRWRIFARDNFTCRYCGARPPDAVLHVDHVLAVANGGTNEEANLATACASCNGGKGARLLAAPVLATPRAGATQTALDVVSEFPPVCADMLGHLVNQMGILQARGVPFDVAALTLMLACLRSAAFIGLRTTPRELPFKEFLDFACAAFEEEIAEQTKSKEPNP